MQIAVFGAGHVGLVHAVGYAHKGHDVICVDTDAAKIEALGRGECTIKEPSLAEYLEAALNFPNKFKQGTLRFVTDHKFAVENSQIAMVCVGTPSSVDNTLDTSQVKEVVDTIVNSCGSEYVIVVKSTMPVGSMRTLETVISKLKNVEILYVPEFLSEGSAVKDFMTPSRVVVGQAEKKNYSNSDWRLDVLHPRHNGPLLLMEYESAELSKLSANAFLATKVSFINEVAMLAEASGADIGDIQRCLTLDPRIGKSYLQSGVGWGGYCLPKDVSAMQALQEKHGFESNVIAGAARQNAVTLNHIVKTIEAYYLDLDRNASSERATDLTIAVIGFAFKPNTNDTRGSPRVKLIETLASRGFKVNVWDALAVYPHATDGVQQFDSIRQCITGVDGIVTLSEHRGGLDAMVAAPLVKTRVIFDTTGYEEGWESYGFEFYGFGRTPLLQKPET